MNSSSFELQLWQQQQFQNYLYNQISYNFTTYPTFFQTNIQNPIYTTEIFSRFIPNNRTRPKNPIPIINPSNNKPIKLNTKHIGIQTDPVLKKKGIYK